MDQLRRAVIDLVTFGLQGDSDGVRQLALRLLRRTAGEDRDDAELRESLARLVLAPARARGVAVRPAKAAASRGGNRRARTAADASEALGNQEAVSATESIAVDHDAPSVSGRPLRPPTPDVRAAEGGLGNSRGRPGRSGLDSGLDGNAEPQGDTRYGTGDAVRELTPRTIMPEPLPWTHDWPTSQSRPAEWSRAASEATDDNRGAPLPPIDGDTHLSLVAMESATGAPAPLLTTAIAAEIDQLIRERRRSAELVRVGVEPTRSVLLTGAPGVGKTMTARYIAGALDLPLVSIDLATVVSSYLGKTGQNLRQALDFARTTPCVLLLDEFDALAKRRDDPTDIGELKRIVNVLLLELDRWPAFGLLIAATNHPELLDRAIWRRFERTIALELPDADLRRRMLAAAAASYNERLAERDIAAIAGWLEGASGADITAMVRRSIRDTVLNARDEPRLPGAFAAALRKNALNYLQASAGSTDRARRRFAIVASTVLGQTQREIAAQLGVSHVSVGKWLREHRAALASGADEALRAHALAQDK